MPETPLLTIQQVARELGCSPVTIYRRVWDGQLEAVRLGEHGPLRVRPDAVGALPQPAHESTEAAGA